MFPIIHCTLPFGDHFLRTSFPAFCILFAFGDKRNCFLRYGHLLKCTATQPRKMGGDGEGGEWGGAGGGGSYMNAHAYTHIRKRLFTDTRTRRH